MRMKLNTKEKLLAETKRVQKEFIKQGSYWNLEDCLDMLVKNGNIVTNIESIYSTRLVVQTIDSKVNEIIND